MNLMMMMRSMLDELQKIAMPRALVGAAGKMFGGSAASAADKLRGVGLPQAMRASIPSRVPRPGQLSGALAPPSRVPRPNPTKLGPSAMAPPPPTARKAPINWEQGNYNFSGR